MVIFTAIIVTQPKSPHRIRLVWPAFESHLLDWWNLLCKSLCLPQDGAQVFTSDSQHWCRFINILPTFSVHNVSRISAVKDRPAFSCTKKKCSYCSYWPLLCIQIKVHWMKCLNLSFSPSFTQNLLPLEKMYFSVNVSILSFVSPALFHYENINCCLAQ